MPAIALNSPRTGHLAQYTHNWARITTTDLWVLNQLSGHTLELIATSVQGGAPKEFHLSQELDHKLEVAPLGDLKDVCGPKKGWQCETHNQPERTEQVHTLGKLQDGRNSSGERSSAGRKLDGQDQPQG